MSNEKNQVAVNQNEKDPQKVINALKGENRKLRQQKGELIDRMQCIVEELCFYKNRGFFARLFNKKYPF